MDKTNVGPLIHEEVHEAQTKPIFSENQSRKLTWEGLGGEGGIRIGATGYPARRPACPFLLNWSELCENIQPLISLPYKTYRLWHFSAVKLSGSQAEWHDLRTLPFKGNSDFVDGWSQWPRGGSWPGYAWGGPGPGPATAIVVVVVVVVVLEVR